jgi:type III pantothenate kinase
MIREIRDRLINERFKGSDPVVLGTGGFARLFADTGLFNTVHPDLVLEGVRIAQELNQ